MIAKKNKFFCLWIFTICCLLSGCATLPPRETGLTVYNLNGISYVSLIALCERRNINWDYDTFARTVALNRGSEEIHLMLGSPTAVVNGTAKDIRYPVEIYQGMIVVPNRFKEEVIDLLFKPYARPGISYQPLISRIKKIIIDPGHGGIDPGAIGRTGLREKDVCLDISRRVKTIIESSGIEVILTRSYDKTIALSERTRLANQRDADLYISIHANANRVRSLKGFEVYYLSPKVDDYRRAYLAAGNTDLRFKEAFFLNHNLNLKTTVWDLVYTQNRAESAELGRDICRAVNENMSTKILGVKAAPFYVLKNSQMPAVLVETGFLSNPEEERMLKNNFYRQQIAEAIAAGIRNYCRGYVIMEAER